MSTSGAPYARLLPYKAMVDNKMCIWGGYLDPFPYFSYYYPGTQNYNGKLNNGGCYDPESDSWTSMSTENAPEGVMSGAMGVIGSKMCIWSGSTKFGYILDLDYKKDFVKSGSCYDVKTDTWTEIKTEGAPNPFYNPFRTVKDGELCVTGQTYETLYFKWEKACYNFETQTWKDFNIIEDKYSQLYYKLNPYSTFISNSRIFLFTPVINEDQSVYIDPWNVEAPPATEAHVNTP